MMCTAAFRALQPLTDAAQVASNLAELLGHQVVRLKEVLAAIEQHAALAQHGLTQALLSAILGFGLQSVLEARLVTGPQGLRDLDMKNVERLVWINFLHRVFRKSPVTQACPSPAAKPGQCCIHQAGLSNRLVTQTYMQGQADIIIQV